MPGFGKLLPAAEGVAGSSNSLAEYVIGDVESCLERLPDEILSPERKNAIRERFAGAHAALDRSAGVLVHGDFRFKNILMDGLRVSASLDFEMAISGEPAMDLAWLLYSDGKDAQDLEAILKGYRDEGGPDLNPGMRKRLLLYELRYALEHLWWIVSFQDEPGISEVLDRIGRMLHGLDNLKCTSDE